MEETLGKRIATNRKRLGITQDRLAEQLGVTAQAVSKWENDQSCPDITMLPKLAEIFAISVDALLGVETHEKILVSEVIDTEESTDEPDGIHIHNGTWEFKWDSGRSSLLSTAVLFIWVGIVYMLRSISGQPTNLWSLLWPSALLIYGGFALYGKFTFMRLCCTFLGACFLFSNMNDMKLGGAFILPPLLILLGISLLIKAFRKPHKPHFSIIHNGKSITSSVSGCSIGDDSFDIDCSFGEKSHVITMPCLRRGDADVSFGHMTLDLTSVESFAPDCSIDVDCSFGELIILMPKHVRVEVDSDTAFGSVSIRGNHDSETVGSAFIDADASFGQITVNYV